MKRFGGEYAFIADKVVECSSSNPILSNLGVDHDKHNSGYR
jgi:hypothetical protein